MFSLFQDGYVLFRPFTEEHWFLTAVIMSLPLCVCVSLCHSPVYMQCILSYELFNSHYRVCIYSAHTRCYRTNWHLRLLNGVHSDCCGVTSHQINGHKVLDTWIPRVRCTCSAISLQCKRVGVSLLVYLPSLEHSAVSQSVAIVYACVCACMCKKLKTAWDACVFSLVLLLQLAFELIFTF